MKLNKSYPKIYSPKRRETRLPSGRKVELSNRHERVRFSALISRGVLLKDPAVLIEELILHVKSLSYLDRNLRLSETAKRWLGETPVMWVLHNGREGLAKWKRLVNFVARFVLRVPPAANPLPDSRIPPFIKRMMRKGRKDPCARLAVLSVLGVYRMIELKPEIKLSSISDCYEGEFTFPIRTIEWGKSLTEACIEFQKRFNVKPLLDLTFRCQVSFASGPNGPCAWRHSVTDYLALLRGGFINVLRTFVKSFTWKNPEDIYDLFGNHDQFRMETPPIKTPLHSRLAFLTDKGGKTRVVGIGDVFSQSLLEPVHDHIFRILREVPMDGTFDQDAQRERVRVATLNNMWCHSIDMSSCTDRFPVRIQSEILSMIGIMTEEQSSAWLSLISDRPFTYTDTDGQCREIRYSVGQPMGLLSSWAVMALSHHILVLWAATRCRHDRFDAYAILGDDVVIWDNEVANVYLEILSKLGIKVSALKSFNQRAVAEFAKCYFMHGRKYKPISPFLTRWSNFEGPTNVVTVARTLVDQGFRFRKRPITWFWSAFTQLDRIGLILLLCIYGFGHYIGIKWSPTKEMYNWMKVQAYNNSVRVVLRDRARVLSELDSFVLSQPGAEFLIFPPVKRVIEMVSDTYGEIGPPLPLVYSHWELYRSYHPKPEEKLFEVQVKGDTLWWDYEYWECTRSSKGPNVFNPVVPVEVDPLRATKLLRRPVVINREWRKLLKLYGRKEWRDLLLTDPYRSFFH